MAAGASSSLEQRGQIRIVRDGQLLGDPFLDLSDRLTAGGERGLLGLAFHPDFPDDPRFFVNYTDLDGNTVVSSFTAEAETTTTLRYSAAKNAAKRPPPYSVL